FASGQTTAAHQVVDRRPLELRHLLQHLVSDVSSKVIGPDVDQRTLVGTPNRGATEGHDDRLSHGARFSLRGANCRFRWYGLQLNEVAELVAEPLLGVSERATRVEPTAIFDVAPRCQMAAGRPGAKRLVPGVRGVKIHRLIPGTICQVVRKRSGIATTIG